MNELQNMVVMAPAFITFGRVCTLVVKTKGTIATIVMVPEGLQFVLSGKPSLLSGIGLWLMVIERI